MIRLIVIFCALIIYSCDQPAVDSRPNILLIVADDLGYADLGAYGGDIETPNIDKLAKTGLRFSRFHSSPLCSPTRAMLLSGNDNHIAGIGIQGVRLDQWGYEGHISERVAIIPEILSESGYNTYMSGKWHLGATPDANPHNRGFKKSFINKTGAGNHYSSKGMFAGRPISSYSENGRDVEWPKGAYSTDLFTDKLIEYIEEDLNSNKPFFAFAAYTSPHWPLQVDEKYWKKYEGRYDDGYSHLKRDRLESLVEADLIPRNTPLPPDHPRVIPWDSLSIKQQHVESRKMELYAGMVDNLDENIGRLLEYLKKNKKLKNTIVIFMSDNGAAAENFYYHQRYGEFLKANYTDAYDSMGKESSFISYGPQWAEAGTSPFRYFKAQMTEGGLIAPLIISGPGVNWEGDTFHGMLSLLDLAPSIYEIAGAEYPKEFNGRKIYPLRGQSLAPLLLRETETSWDEERIFAMEHAGLTMLRKGDWKLINNQLPWDSSNFQLYDMGSDIGELNDLKNKNPEKFSELMKEWRMFIDEVGAVLPAPVEFD